MESIYLNNQNFEDDVPFFKVNHESDNEKLTPRP